MQLSAQPSPAMRRRSAATRGGRGAPQQRRRHGARLAAAAGGPRVALERLPDMEAADTVVERRAADVAVVGGGVAAALAALSLARGGRKVLLLPDFGLAARTPPPAALHALRLPDADPLLVHLASESAAYWRGLELLAGAPLLSRHASCDAVLDADRDHPGAEGFAKLQDACAAAGVAAAPLSGSEAATRFRQLQLPHGAACLVQPDGGVLHAQDVDAAARQLARGAGVTLRPGLVLRGWRDRGSCFQLRASTALTPELVSLFEAEVLLLAPAHWHAACFGLFGLQLDGLEAREVLQCRLPAGALTAQAQQPLLQTWGAFAPPDQPQQPLGLGALPLGGGSGGWALQQLPGWGRAVADPFAWQPAAAQWRALRDGGDADEARPPPTPAGAWAEAQVAQLHASCAALVRDVGPLRSAAVSSSLRSCVADGRPVVGGHPGFDPGRVVVAAGAAGGARFGPGGGASPYQAAPMLAKLSADAVKAAAGGAGGALAAGLALARAGLAPRAALPADPWDGLAALQRAPPVSAEDAERAADEAGAARRSGGRSARGGGAAAAVAAAMLAAARAALAAAAGASSCCAGGSSSASGAARAAAGAMRALQRRCASSDGAAAAGVAHAPPGGLDASQLTAEQAAHLRALRYLMARPLAAARDAAALTGLAAGYRDLSVIMDQLHKRDMFYPVRDLSALPDAAPPAGGWLRNHLKEQYMTRVTAFAQLLPNHLEVSYQTGCGIVLWPAMEAFYPALFDVESALRYLKPGTKRTRTKRPRAAKRPRCTLGYQRTMPYHKPRLVALPSRASSAQPAGAAAARCAAMRPPKLGALPSRVVQAALVAALLLACSWLALPRLRTPAESACPRAAAASLGAPGAGDGRAALGDLADLLPRLLPRTNFSALAAADVLDPAIAAGAPASELRRLMQLHSRLFCAAGLHEEPLPGSRAVQLGNASLHVYGGRDIVSAHIAGGARTWEAAETQALLWALRQPPGGARRGGAAGGAPVAPLVVDVGANVGWFMANAAAAGARVAAFEAMAANAALLRRTLCANPWLHERIALFATGLGNASASCFVISDVHNAVDGHTKCTAGEPTAPPGYAVRGAMTVRRLDTLVAEDVQVLKIDVEGHEAQVLAGAARLFERHAVSYVMLECNLGIIGDAGGRRLIACARRRRARRPGAGGSGRDLDALGFAVSAAGFRGPFWSEADVRAGRTGCTSMNLYATRKDLAAR
ncbi:hypothetical protein HT031_001180 [Scenedesmus sp. PABB004]|nr:hypothetical protein HT031_001180 [Scenedesmus sp. PABB004]